MAALIGKVATRRPLVQNITNFVAMDISANVLLAVGASPAMVSAIEEVAEFVALADALAVNIGTLSRASLDSMLLAAKTARVLGKPWVLDPVGVGATAFRNGAAAALLAHGPSIVRGNASEIMALARIAGAGGDAARPKGVDSGNTTAEAEQAAVALARMLDCTVAATGEIDFVTDGTRSARIAGGSGMMATVTGVGCALSALAAAYAAVETDSYVAACAALQTYAIAGGMAGEQCEGPGSFRMIFLDMLNVVDREEFMLKADFQPCA